MLKAILFLTLGVSFTAGKNVDANEHTGDAFQADKLRQKVESGDKDAVEELDDEGFAPDTGTCTLKNPEACSESMLTSLKVQDQVKKLIDDGNALASAAEGVDDLEGALELFEEAFDTSRNRSSNAEVNVALVLRKLKRDAEALPRLKHAVELEPQNFYARYNLANLVVDGHDWIAADVHYKKAMEVAPPHGQMSLRNNWANMLVRAHYYKEKDDYFEGRDLYREAYRLIEPVIEAVEQEQEGLQLLRPHVNTIEKILWALDKTKVRKKLHKMAVKLGFWHRPNQRPQEYNSELSQFQTKPFWTSEQAVAAIPWLAKVQKRWKKLQEELDTVIRNKIANQVGLRTKDDTELYDKSTGAIWTEHGVVMGGKVDAFGANHAPLAAEFLKDELFVKGEEEGQVRYSVIYPNTKLVPHCGHTNERLTCHLGLLIPSGGVKVSGISVGGEKKAWKEGEWTCFEDSYEHFVWNKSPMPRGVLVVYMRHPKFTKS